MTDQDSTRVGHGRQITDGLPPKAQTVYVFSAIIVGVWLGLFLNQSGIDAELALPVGFLAGVFLTSVAALAALAGYCRATGGNVDD